MFKNQNDKRNNQNDSRNNQNTSQNRNNNQMNPSGAQGSNNRFASGSTNVEFGMENCFKDDKEKTSNRREYPINRDVELAREQSFNNNPTTNTRKQSSNQNQQNQQNNRQQQQTDFGKNDSYYDLT